MYPFADIDRKVKYSLFLSRDAKAKVLRNFNDPGSEGHATRRSA